MIHYNIENINPIISNKSKKIHITGWAFSDTEESLDIYINSKLCKYKKVSREDIQIKFKLKSTLHGFEILFPYTSDLQIIFYNNIKNESINYSYQGIKAPCNDNSLITLNRIKKFYFICKNCGIKSALLKTREWLDNKKIKNHTTLTLFNQEYTFSEISIPEEWLNIQKIKPSFGLIVNFEIGDPQSLKDNITKLKEQSYQNYKIIISGDIDKSIIELFDKYSIPYTLDALECFDYYIYFECKDILSINTLAFFVEAINLGLNPDIIYGDYDHITEDNKYIVPIKKEKLTINPIVISRGIYASKSKDINLEYLSDKNIFYSEKILIHKKILKHNNSSVKALAFYLPQFHTFPENDKWWGKGFTEWVNVKRGKPMYFGHNQPRVPRELGYYDLIEDPTIQLKQAMLAKEFGLYGFCYYYYWFNGKRLMEKPIDNIINNKEIALPFCVCWANENWTRRWDGLEKEILIEQVHEPDSDKRFIKDVSNLFHDERYIKINNKPLLLIYKIQLLYDGKSSIMEWRKEIKKLGFDGLYVAIIKQPGVNSAEEYGADALVEFPPHSMNCTEVTSITQTNKDFSGHLFDYGELAHKPLLAHNEVVFKGCMLQWDNTARRMQNSNAFVNFKPKYYMDWLLQNKEYEILMNKPNEQFIFINAWNEWAEGTYLEPDEEHGTTLLQITKEIMESE